MPLVLALVLGVLVVGGAVVAGVLLHGGDTDSAAAPGAQAATPTEVTTAEPTDQSVPRRFLLDQAIAPGTCYDVVSQTFDLSDATVVDCAGPHRMEFVSTYRLTKPYVNQGDPRVGTDQRSCWQDVLRPRVADDPKLLADSAALTWYPSAAQIASGQTTAYCVLVADTSQGGSDLLLGSLVDGTYQGVLP